MYSFRSTYGPVALAFTDRLGGVSAAPFALGDQPGLNLAVSGPDDEVAKATNHRLLLDDLAPGAVLADLYQVHGREVVDVDAGSASRWERPQADGIVTKAHDVALLVRAADCVPVLLADAEHGVIGAAHAGRQGMALGVVPATVERMRALGAETISAWIGPAICGRCYEVPAELQDEVAAVEPAARATTSWGTPALDVAAGVRAQLERDGVTAHCVGGCTRESDDLYSYRRDGESAGRLAGVVVLRREGSTA